MADNQSALKLLKNPVLSVRSKHIDVVYLFGESAWQGRIWSSPTFALMICWRQHIRADMFTKPVPGNKLHLCCDGIGVKSC